MDELCSFDPDTHNPELDMVLREWERTNSPLIHWYNSIVKVTDKQSLNILSQPLSQAPTYGIDVKGCDARFSFVLPSTQPSNLRNILNQTHPLKLKPSLICL